MCGLTPFLIRLLVDNPFDGGGGYPVTTVGDMTPDQAFMRLTDRKLLRRRATVRVIEQSSIELLPGPVKGRTAAGKPIKGFIAGRSKASILAEAANQKQGRRKRRGKRNVP